MHKIYKNEELHSLGVSDTSNIFVLPAKIVDPVSQCKGCMLRKSNLISADEYYNSIGINIEDANDSSTYLVTLPEGWSINTYINANPGVKVLLDDKGRKRLDYYYSHLLSPFKYGTVLPRYKVQVVQTKTEHCCKFTLQLLDGGNVIDDLKYVEVTNPDECDAKRIVLEATGKRALNIKYPDWRNPLAYWD